MILMHSSGLKCRKSGFGGFGVAAHGGRRLAGSLEMHGQLGAGDRHSSGALSFERSADFAVKLCTGRWRRALVQHLAEQRVPERIRRLCRLAAFLGTRGDEPQLLARELVADVTNPVGVPLERGRDRIDAELDTANGGRREQRALLVLELGDVVLDDRRQVLGNGDLRHLLGGNAAAALRGARAHLAHDGCDEQRQSVGALVQRAHERFVAGDRWRSFRHVFRDLCFGERSRTISSREPMQAQLAPQRIERMIERHDLGETKACEPHEARVAAPSRDIVDELDRRAIAPMQVLGHEQQRPALARAIQKLAHLAQHAICGDTGELSPQSVALLGGAEPRQLQEPGRRDRTQQRDERAVDAAQLGQRFEDGEVGLAAAVLVDALAADAKNIAETRQRNARSASSCRYPARRQPRRSRRLPVHAQSQSARSRDNASARPMNDSDSAERLCGTTVTTRWRSDYRAGGRDEAIPSPRHRFDEARVAGIVVERRPQLADRGSQYRVGDVLVTPNLIEQCVRREQGAWLSDESAQYSEGRRRESDRGSVAQQARVCLVQLESVEAHSYRIRATRRCSLVGTLSHFDTNGVRDRPAMTMASIRLWQWRPRARDAG